MNGFMRTEIEFAELLKRIKVEEAVKTISEYCSEHKTCTQCGLFNGVCRLNMTPSDWDAIAYGGRE